MPILAMQLHLRHHSTNGDQRLRNTKAFNLIEIVIVVGILVLLACVLFASLAYRRRHAKADACKENLKQVGVAFHTWALDCGDAYPTGVTLNNGGARERIEQGQVFFNFLVMSNEIGTPKVLVCPEDNGKIAAAAFSPKFSNTNVSYFVGADAADTYPQTFLTGDRNLAFKGQPLGPGLFNSTTNHTALSWTEAIHNLHGNIGFADGSVQFLDSTKLALAAAGQSCDTNRLAIP